MINNGKNSFDVLIVGGGHGGAQTAIALRQGGFAGSMAIISEEREFPYERPPLSKEYLSGKKTFERILIRPAGFWKERSVKMLLGRRIVSVDPAMHKANTVDGEAIGYSHLVWATGGYPRRLTCEGHDFARVHTVRTRADIDLIAAQLGNVERVSIIGAGYVGLEAAAVLRELGRHVTVFEAQGRVLERFPADLSRRGIPTDALI